ncbi:hypothetical protein SAMN04488506_1404 [Desemzia incerta]|uniref:Uncharacterized protein n=1 Tax=Desemzia incerta TaxID=82801 RepID=A0A1I5XF07_9LACT|nr:hypothetical protein [Desemzia incerta]SFQ30541.1 hypothetical protein SAMN04488506_1404 [Desemzia incerta]
MKKYQLFLAWMFILLAVVILISLPELVYPTISEDGVDTHQYLLEVILHIVRYVILSIFSFILGIKLLHKD